MASRKLSNSVVQLPIGLLREQTRPDRSLVAEWRAYAEWLATPADARVPATRKQLAELLGVPEATLLRWRLDPALTREIRALLVGYVTDHLRDMGDAIVAKAESGDVPAFKAITHFLSHLRSGLHEAR